MAESHGIFGHSLRDGGDLVSSATDIFTLPHHEVGMLSSQEVDIRALTFDGDGPYQFTFRNHGEDMYLNPSACRLYLKFQFMKRTSGAKLAADFVGSVVNSIGTSFFSNADISINGQSVTELTQTKTNYVSYLQTLLSYGKGAEETHLKTQGWTMDTAGTFDTVDESNNTAGEKNEGYHTRKAEFITGSPVIELEMAVPHGFFLMDKLVPPAIQVMLSLTRAKENFFMLSSVADPDARVKFLDMRIRAAYVQMSPQIVSSHQASFSRGASCTLPMKKVVVSSQTFAQGLTKLDFTSIAKDEMPEAVYVGMLEGTASTGAFNKNPYNFKPFKANEIHLIMNGRNIPDSPYKPDFTKKYGITRLYRGFYDNVGIQLEDAGTMVTVDQFMSGCTIIPFDLSPHNCSNLCLHKAHHGSLGAYIGLAAPSEQPIEVIAFSTFNRYLHIDKHGKVVVTSDAVLKT